ncbi:MAG: beta-galactosidase, partial [Tannerellaceae bacterium]|nr:beta-galactosidase [Tannerellaceae bacterium]
MKNLIILLIFLALSGMAAAQNNAIPHLNKNNGRCQLYVDNQPFFMLAGELHNSSTGSAHYMRSIWARMAKQNLNTVIAPVTWELTEPEEGVFDFSPVDSIVAGARLENLRLVLLWFGSWKNGKSMYAPEWVKTDTKRFPLAKDKNGKTLNTLSTFGRNTLKADAKAFAALMNHIKEIDAKEHTVLMIQVQNETGVLDQASAFTSSPNACMRDFSEEANKAFNGKVPEELTKYLDKHKNELYPALRKAWADNGCKKQGAWEEVFGKGTKGEDTNWKERFPYYTEEIFMAWNYACYVGEIVQQGKAAYAIPMYVNAWLKQSRAVEPGQYPSGGPQPQVLDIWRAAAPSIDFIAPDIYEVDEFDWFCEEYTRSGNPLFIPETKTGPASAARAFYALGKYGALGYAPFGIDGGGIINTADPDDKSIEKAYG